MLSVSPVQFSSSVAGRGLVLPVSVRTPAAEDFAALAQSARAPTPARFRLSASLPVGSPIARGPITPSDVIEVYTEAEFGAEIASFLRAPGLRLVLV
jgi:hypothetical protein